MSYVSKLFFAACAMWVSAGVARGDVLSPWKYLKNYHVGLDVSENTNTVVAQYDVDPAAAGSMAQGDDCESVGAKPGKIRCTQEFTNSTAGYGIYLQQPFERQGLFHLNWDISLSLKYIDARLKPKDDVDYSDAPIRSMAIHLYSLVARPYVTIGLTPKSAVPDVLFSFGPTGEAMFGSIDINGESYKAPSSGVYRRSGATAILDYMELEIVPWRFGPGKKGSLSISAANLNGIGHVQEGELVPQELDAMSDFDFKFQRWTLALKVLSK